MTKIWLYTLAMNIFLGLWILLVIYLVSFFQSYIRSKLDYVVAFVGGVLSWIIFLWFFPKILSVSGKQNSVFLSLSILFWILSFYLMELFFHFHHCKDLNYPEVHTNFSWKLMNIWTLLHNMIHWLVIYTWFLVSFKFWIILTLAIFFHSIPQNVANYLMNHKDIKPVIIAALWWIIGAILLYPFQWFIFSNKIYVIAFIAGALLYLVVSDILPEIKKRISFQKQIIYLTFWLIWIWLFYLLEYVSKLIK